MFKLLTTQFFFGKYFEKNPTIQNAEQGHPFRYEKLTDKSKQYTQAINNLIAKAESLTIATSSPLGFTVGGYILDQSGTMYIINDIVSGEIAIEQRAVFFKPVDNNTVLSLTKVGNPLRLSV